MYGLFNNIFRNLKTYKLNSLVLLRPCTKVFYNHSFIKHFVDNIKLKNQKFATKAYDINTNVNKDVILFKYENKKFFNVINIFAFSQFLFWSYLSHFAFTTLRDVPVEKAGPDDPWYKKINLGENKYRNSLTIISFLIGYGVLAAAWLFTLRSVRLLILQKGGKSVSFVTYAPFSRERIMSVPINCLSAETSRECAKTQLPIKVKNRTLFYVLDMRGEFRNPKLFDYTVGLKRKLD